MSETYTDENGVEYDDELGGFLVPIRDYRTQPQRCPNCKTDRLQVIQTAHYETTARCPDCDIQHVVAEG